MSTIETDLTIVDTVQAELVDCVPATPEPMSVPTPENPDASPTERAREATIEQTGAGPPPKGRV